MGEGACTMKKAKSIIDQVVEVLVEDIQGDKYRENRRLPSEKKLAQELGVSRTTVRTALAKLEGEGLITRRQGDGTYVNHRAIDQSISLGGRWDFNYMIESSGRELFVKCLGIELEKLTPSRKKALDLPQEEQVIVLERLYHGDGSPLIHSTNFFPHSLYQGQEPLEAIDYSLPVGDFLGRYFGQRIAYSVSDIRAVLSRLEHEKFLGIEPGTPIFEFEDVFYNAREYPVMIGHNFLNDKVLRLQVAQSWG